MCIIEQQLKQNLCLLCGYYVYCDERNFKQSGSLTDNPMDKFAVNVRKENETVGHLPWEFL